MLAPLERGELARQADLLALGVRLDARLDALESRIMGHIDTQIAKLLYVLVPIMVSLAVLVFAAVKL